MGLPNNFLAVESWWNKQPIFVRNAIDVCHRHETDSIQYRKGKKKHKIQYIKLRLNFVIEYWNKRAHLLPQTVKLVTAIQFNSIQMKVYQTNPNSLLPFLSFVFVDSPPVESLTSPIDCSVLFDLYFVHIFDFNLLSCVSIAFWGPSKSLWHVHELRTL